MSIFSPIGGWKDLGAPRAKTITIVPATAEAWPGMLGVALAITVRDQHGAVYPLKAVKARVLYWPDVTGGLSIAASGGTVIHECNELLGTLNSSGVWATNKPYLRFNGAASGTPKILVSCEGVRQEYTYVINPLEGTTFGDITPTEQDYELDASPEAMSIEVLDQNEAGIADQTVTIAVSAPLGSGISVEDDGTIIGDGETLTMTTDVDGVVEPYLRFGVTEDEAETGDIVLTISCNDITPEVMTYGVVEATP